MEARSGKWEEDDAGKVNCMRGVKSCTISKTGHSSVFMALGKRVIPKGTEVFTEVIIVFTKGTEVFTGG